MVDATHTPGRRLVMGYAGASGIVVAALVQFGILPEMVNRVLSPVLIFLTAYSTNVVSISLGGQRLRAANALLSASGAFLYSVLGSGSGVAGGIVGAVLSIVLFLVATGLANRGVDWKSPPKKLNTRYKVAFRGAEEAEPGFDRKDVVFLWGALRTTNIELLKYATTALALVPYYGGLIAGVFLLAMTDFLIPSSLMLSIFMLSLGFLSLWTKPMRSSGSHGLARRVSVYAKESWERSQSVDESRFSTIVRLFGNPKAFFYLVLIVWVVASSLELLVPTGLLFLGAPALLANLMNPAASAYVLLSTVGVIPNAILPLYLVVSFVWTKLDRRRYLRINHAPLVLLSSGLAVLMIFGPLALVNSHLSDMSWVFGPLVARFYLVTFLGILQIVNVVGSYRRRGAASNETFTRRKAEAILLAYVLFCISVTGGSGVVDFLTFTLVGSWFWYSAIVFLKAVQKWPGRLAVKAPKELAMLAGSFGVIAEYGYFTRQPPFFWLAVVGLAFVGLLAIGDPYLKWFGWAVLGVKEVEAESAG